MRIDLLSRWKIRSFSGRFLVIYTSVKGKMTDEQMKNVKRVSIALEIRLIDLSTRIFSLLSPQVCTLESEVAQNSLRTWGSYWRPCLWYFCWKTVSAWIATILKLANRAVFAGEWFESANFWEIFWFFIFLGLAWLGTDDVAKFNQIIHHSNWCRPHWIHIPTPSLPILLTKRMATCSFWNWRRSRCVYSSVEHIEHSIDSIRFARTIHSEC